MRKRSGYDLTDRSFRISAPPRNAPYWYWLKTNRAIGIRKPTSDKCLWLARYRDTQGRYKRIPLGRDKALHSGSGDALDFEDARTRAEELFADPAISVVAQEAMDLDRRFDLNYCPWGDTYTIGHALWDYAEWIRIGGAHSHFLGVRTRCNYYLLPMLGTLGIEDLTQESYRQFVMDFFERPAARGSIPPDHSVNLEDLDGPTVAKRKRTLNMLIGVLRAALRLAWENGKFDDPRVWKRLRFVPYEKRRRLQYLTQPEALRLINACDSDMRDLVLAALYSGLRLKELSRIRVRDVARDGFGLYAATAKTQRSRFVFLSDEGMAHFLRLIDGKAEGDLVLTTRSGGAWNYNYTRRFKVALAKAGINDNFTIHGLRHTYASRLVQAGVPFGVVADQLGHNGPETVMQTYAHFAPQVREAEIRQRSDVLSFNPLSPDIAQATEDAVATRIGTRRVRYADIQNMEYSKRANFIVGDVALAKYLGGLN